ncbi:HNH endonuclease [Streptomyces sp. NPDC050439]|uniref:HNH endonuclease signature motif containing protein n=1 Tax=unclassified Streptomyces TaxID=2593676 RepID=UPI0034155F63
MEDLTVGHPPEPIPITTRVVHLRGEPIEFTQEQITRLFWVKINRAAPGGCWAWTGSRLPNGYGRITIARRDLYSHRVSYEIHKGQIPNGLHIDHLCRVRACCNPDHLEAVTCRENIMRSPIAPAAINARKTHCAKDHEFTAANTGQGSDGTRYCRTCARLRFTGSPLTISPGDVPPARTDLPFGAPARPGGHFSSSTGWSHAITQSDMNRFWSKVSEAAPETCWKWTANCDRSGYGMFHLAADGIKRQVNAHRFAYFALVGAAPEGSVLEHLCLVRTCVNPAHIVPVTRQTNEALRLSRLAREGQR